MSSSDGLRHHRQVPENNNGRLRSPACGGRFDSSAGASAVVGHELTVSDLAALEARWIDRALAEQALLRRVDSMTGGELVGRKRGDFGGIAIPYFMPGSTCLRDYRLRRDQPDLERDRTGQLRTKQKYLSPPGRGNMLYVPPAVDDGLLKNVAVLLIITEGEFKTLALWRLANWSFRTASVCSGRHCGGIQLAGNGRQSERANRRTAEYQRADPGSGLDPLERSPCNCRVRCGCVEQGIRAYCPSRLSQASAEPRGDGGLPGMGSGSG